MSSSSRSAASRWLPIAWTVAMALATAEPARAEDEFSGRRVSATLERTIPGAGTWRTSAFTGLPADRGETVVRRYRVPDAVLVTHTQGDAIVVDLADCVFEAELDTASGLEFPAPDDAGCTLWVGVHTPPPGSGRPTLVLHQAVLVSGVAVAVRGSARALDALAFDTQSGLPVAGLELAVSRSGGDPGAPARTAITSGVTDGMGLAHLELPPGAAGGALLVEGSCERGLALAFTEPAPAFPAPPEAALVTDRAGYRPGERMECLALACGDALLGGAVELRDRTQQVVATSPLRAEAHAEALRGELDLPPELADGQYLLGLAGAAADAGVPVEIRRRRVAVCEVTGRWEWLERDARPASARLDLVARSPGGAPVAGLELIAAWRVPGASTDADRRAVSVDADGAASVTLTLPAAFAPALAYLEVRGPPWVTVSLEAPPSTPDPAAAQTPVGLDIDIEGEARPGATVSVRVRADPDRDPLRCVWVTVERFGVVGSAVRVCETPAATELALAVELSDSIEPGDHAIHVVAITAGDDGAVVSSLARSLQVLPRVGAPRLEGPAQEGPAQEGATGFQLRGDSGDGGAWDWIAAWGARAPAVGPAEAARRGMPLAPLGGCKLGGIASFARLAVRASRAVATGELGQARLGGDVTGTDPSGSRPTGAPVASGLAAGRGGEALRALLSGLHAPAASVALRDGRGRMHWLRAEVPERAAAAATVQRELEAAWLGELELALPELWVPVWGGAAGQGVTTLPVRAIAGIPTRILCLVEPADPPAGGPARSGASPTPLLLGGAVDPFAPNDIPLDSPRARVWWQTVRDADDPLEGVLAASRLRNAPGAAELPRQQKLLLERPSAAGRRSGAPAVVGVLLAAGDPMLAAAGQRMLAGGAGAHEALLRAALAEGSEQLRHSGAWQAVSPWLRGLVQRAIARGATGTVGPPPVRWIGAESTCARTQQGPGFASGEPLEDAPEIQIELPWPTARGPWWVCVQRAARAWVDGASRRIEIGVVTAAGPAWRQLEPGAPVRPGSVLRIELGVSGLVDRAPYLIEQELPAGLTRLAISGDRATLVASPPGPVGLLVEDLHTRSLELLVEVGLPGSLVLPPPRVVFLQELGTAGVLSVPPLLLEVR